MPIKFSGEGRERERALSVRPLCLDIGMYDVYSLVHITTTSPSSLTSQTGLSLILCGALTTPDRTGSTKRSTCRA